MSNKNYKINFIPPAVEDIEDAKHWYNNKREGLGDEFVDELETTVDTFQNNPYQFAEKHENVRQAQTNRFPYLISYIIEKIEIIILSVLHGSRNPKVMKKRYQSKK